MGSMVLAGSGSFYLQRTFGAGHSKARARQSALLMAPARGRGRFDPAFNPINRDCRSQRQAPLQVPQGRAVLAQLGRKRIEPAHQRRGGCRFGFVRTALG